MGPLLDRLPPALAAAALCGALGGCAPPAGGGVEPAGPRRVVLDFEERGWSGPMERCAAAARTGEWGARLAFEGLGRVLVVGPLIELDGCERLEVEAWTWMRRLDAGAALLRVSFFRADGSPHPALPPAPVPLEGVLLAQWSAAEVRWTPHRVSLLREGRNAPGTAPAGAFPAAADSARVELVWSAPVAERGEVFLDDVVFAMLPGEP